MFMLTMEMKKQFRVNGIRKKCTILIEFIYHMNSLFMRNITIINAIYVIFRH